MSRVTETTTFCLGGALRELLTVSRRMLLPVKYNLLGWSLLPFFLAKRHRILLIANYILSGAEIPSMLRPFLRVWA
jgi:hypothetical protein